MTNTRYQPSKEAVLAQLKKMTNSAIGRSKNHRKLLEYLVNRELDSFEGPNNNDKTPKEIEIAIDVFGKSVNFNPAEDSTVRVNISNLRKKLENYYLEQGNSDDFYISIPVGAYRLTFTEKKESKHLVQACPPIQTSKDNQQKKHSLIKKKYTTNNYLKWFLVVSVIANLLFVFLWFSGITQPITKHNTINVSKKNSLSSEPLWADFYRSKRPALIVMGDLHSFIEIDNKRGLRRTIVDPQINDNEQQKQYIQTTLNNATTIAPSQQKLITKGSNLALRNVLRLFKDKNVNIRLASEIDAYHLRKFDIIYIGPLHAMRAFNQYFKGSGLAFNSQISTLTSADKIFTYKSPENLAQGYVDYGLFAKFDGPSGNLVYVISGFSDPSIMHVSWYLTSQRDLTSKEFNQFKKAHQLTSENNIEFLFKVPSIDGVDMKYDLIYGGNIDSSAIWTSP